jgi:hypothetical protein
MDRSTDGRGEVLETGTPVRVGGSVGGGSHLSPSSAADIRRFRVAHALEAIENALILLHPTPAEGVEVSALERVRDDLRVVLRTIGATR